MTIYSYEGGVDKPAEFLQIKLSTLVGVSTDLTKVATQSEFATSLVSDLPPPTRPFSLSNPEPSGIVELTDENMKALEVGDKIYAISELPRNLLLPPSQQPDKEHAILTVTQTKEKSL